MRKLTASYLVWGLIGAAAVGVVSAACPPGDLTGDCRVDPLDLEVFAEHWLVGTEAGADFDANGQVGLEDFQVLAQAWRASQIPLVINEVMAANSAFAKDLNGDFDDWIELYNAGRSAIDLGGMYLTDDPTEPTKWQFPTNNRALTTIAPQGYLILWADEDPTGVWLHAGFKLDADGDEIHLFDADGVTLLDSLVFGRQTPDISYGRYPDAGNTVRFFGVPTPGQPNNDGYLGEIEPLRFSQERGFYDSPFDLTIACPTEGAEIIYTVDGKMPDDEGGRFRAGKEYTAPLHIDSTVVMRAMAIKSGWKPTAVFTHTYIFNASESIRSLPAISLVGSSGKTFYEPDGVMAIVGGKYDGGVWTSTGAGSYNNVMNRGLERPVSCEWIEPEDNGGFQIDCGLRVHGSNWMRPRYVRQNGYWSGNGKFSLRLYFRNQYGPGPLEFPLIPESEVEWFKSIVLRGGHNDRTNPFVKDELLRRLHKDMGQRASMGTFATLFINGQYKGYYNPTEHIKDDACQQWFDSDEPWDVMTMNGLRDGNSQSWNDMLNYARANSLASDAHYQEMLSKLDVVSFIDYLIIRLWPNDWDWPQNNWAAAAERSATGRWKFFSWDAEGTFVSSQLYLDRFGELNSQGNPNGELYRALKANQSFRQLFADRIYKHFYHDGALSAGNINARFSDLRRQLRGVIPNMDTYIVDSWTPNRRQVFIEACVREGMYTFDGPIFAVNGSFQHGGYAATGDQLQMVPTRVGAEVYYTLDGTDPSGAQVSAEMPVVTLFGREATKHILVPEGPEDVEDWMGIRGFDDAGWILSEGFPGGVGYESNTGYEDYINVDLERLMYGANGSCYIRIPFSFTGDRDAFERLTLRMRYDDGFVAYLNGAEVARRNFEGEPAWNSTATASHNDTDAVVFESIDISDSLIKLRNGANVFAIQGLNVSTTSSDLLIVAELIATREAAVTAPTGALRYTEPITLSGSARFKARVRDGNTWSALSDVAFAVGPVAESLRISEIMYHPDDPNAEYIELTNVGAETINLNLVKFTKGIEFAFPEIDLPPQAYILLVRDAAAFEASHGPGLAVVGSYAGSLSNAGERIELLDAAGAVVQSFRYRDEWYDITDGAGFSLTARDPAQADLAVWARKSAWRPSAVAGGSPGFDDIAQVPELGAIVINELLANSAGGAADWIELYNSSDLAIDVGGWFLSDERNALAKYEIAAGTVIEPRGYLVLSDDQHFGNEGDPGCHEPFGLSRNGETVYLHSGADGVLTGYSEQVTFGPSDSGQALGRYGISTGAFDFVALETPTPGQANAAPRVGPIVISEIMYHPEGVDEAEYVELLNVSDADVTLYDFTEMAPWRFTDDPDNPSIELLFPEDPPVTLEAGVRLVLVKDQALFDSLYAVRASVQVLQWPAGSLDNTGEPLQLSRPGRLDGDGDRPWIAADRVVYSDGSHGACFPGGVDPWPAEADGLGLALMRTVPDGYGNDPNNWSSDRGSPGAALYRPLR